MTAASAIEIIIDRLGVQGDGVATVDGKAIYVAGVAPGDRVRVAVEKPEGNGMRGRALELIEAGDARAAPPCPHFGTCGGCALQHLRPEVYRDWKRGLLVEALARNGVAAGEIADLAGVGDGTRRRGTFFVEKAGGAVRAGFHERGSHTIAAIDGCLVLAPELKALVARLPQGFADVLADGERAEIVANLLETGVDAVVRLSRPADPATRARLGRFANDADLARLSVARIEGRDRTVKTEVVTERRAALASFGGVKVPVPPAAFLQASADAETLMTAEAIEAMAGVGQAGNVADLFAGAGTFAFALAKTARVHAVEGDADLVAALKAGALKAGLGARVTAVARDLFKRPLGPDELKPFAAVVFDPPRVGAAAQAAALAQSNVRTIVGVSCNPQTFARDARLLQDGGYRLIRAVPIDQFRWTHHLEVVASFAR